MDNNRVMVFDTTLRDGEQAAGFRLGAEDKLEIARQLASLKVDAIEAGFPISSPEDFKAVCLLSEEVEGPIIVALSRAVPEDIDECGRALAKAKKPRIHTGIGVSDIHIAGKFRGDKYGKTMEEKRERIFQMAVESVKRAKKYVDDVEFYAEDAGRCDCGYLYQVLEGVIDAGTTVVNIPDTTGYAVPDQFGDLIRGIRENVSNIDRAVISIHCHNDLGMAVVNSLIGIKHGARQVECTINGIGERAGNAALEEVVMALRTRRDYFGVDTNIETRELYRTSQLVARLLGLVVPPNKAIVGPNAFAHSAGIHIDGFLKDRETYEIMHPEDIGFPKSKIKLTARSGRHAVRHRLEEVGYRISQPEMELVYKRFLTEADKILEVSDEILRAIVEDELHNIPEFYHLEYLHASSGSGTIPTATVRIKIGDEIKQEASCGDGPVDATYKAINRIVDTHIQLIDYSIKAVSSGAETIGEVTIKIRDNGEIIIGRGASTDIIEASAKAYIDGLNKLVFRRNLS